MHNRISMNFVMGFLAVLALSVAWLGNAAPLTAANAGFQTFRQRACPTGMGLGGHSRQRLQQGVQQRVISADMPRQGILAVLANPCLAVEYAQSAHTAGRQYEARNSSSCVDSYFEVVAFSWHFLELADSHRRPEYARAWQLYHSGLARLIATGQQYGRLHPEHGLTVNTAVGTQTIAMTYRGFLWEPSDFNRLVVLTESEPKKLANRYRCPGWGVPLVAQRLRKEPERFMLKEVNFSATAVLRPSLAALAGTAPPVGAPSSHHPFELYDPLRIKTLAMNGRPIALASDLSGSFEQGLKDADVSPLQGLLQPGATSNKAQLFMIEPYQPGKFPLVFVHGLLSSPKIWANLANEILRLPGPAGPLSTVGFPIPDGPTVRRFRSRLARGTKCRRRQHGPRQSRSGHGQHGAGRTQHGRTGRKAASNQERRYDVVRRRESAAGGYQGHGRATPGAVPTVLFRTTPVRVPRRLYWNASRRQFAGTHLHWSLRSKSGGRAHARPNGVQAANG